MIEAPDRRVWYFFVPVMLLGIIFLAAPPESVVSRVVEPLLYVLCIAMGSTIGVLSVREGHSLLHPSITASDAPILFWLEVGVGCIFFAGVGVWNLVRVFGGAG